MPDSGRVLAIAPNWLGDAVMALPALWALRVRHQAVEVGVHIPLHLADLLDHEEFVPLPWRKGDTLLKRVMDIRRGGYRLAVIFPNSFRTALIPFLAGIPERVGYGLHGRDFLLTRKIRKLKGIHDSASFMRVVEGLIATNKITPNLKLPSLKVNAKDRGWVEEVLSSARIREEDTVVGLFPGAKYGPAKRWFPERFARLGRMIRRRLGARVLLMGGAEERGMVGEIARTIGGDCVDLSGRTTLGQLMAILKRCRILVSNDTGPMHLASTLGVPVVGIFGSSDPKKTHPLGPHRIVRADVGCSPCFRRRCPEYSYRCLKEISVEEVMGAVEGLLEDEDLS